MSSGKRKIETIDLTNRSDNEFDDCTSSQRNKFAKPNLPSSSSQQYGTQSGASYLTPPTSSQASSSQHSSSQRSSQFNEPTHSYRPDYGALGGVPHLQDGWQGSTQEMEDEARREIDLTQDFDDDVYDDYELYGILNTKIVGCRYYDGRVTVGEYVTVRREPSNPYDHNAIRIDNVRAMQIGHIPRQVAAKLAGLMDSKALLVEGAITGEKGSFDCPCALKLFGTTDPVAAAALKKQMQDLRLPVTDHIKAEVERKKKAKELERRRKEAERAASSMRKLGGLQVDENRDARYASFAVPGMDGEHKTMDELLSNAHTFNPRDVKDIVNKFASGEDVLAKMKTAKQPTAMTTMLLPYQRQGLQWMLDQESPQLPVAGSKDAVQLWRNKNGMYHNIATNFTTKQAPELASGGILADDMGLGKTIQVISLIMADPHRTRQPTLIVAPLSVMSNWSKQGADHVHKKYAPRVLIFHGPEKKDMGPKDFEEYDIVITTYQTMALSLYPHGKDKPNKVPSEKGLYSVQWRRIVLDEGHQIRNPKAKMAQAACAIMAKSRWVLTGTPIVNTLKDLYSHIKFIRLSGGMAEFDIFNGTLMRPLKDKDPAAPVLLQALMATVCLRRMKYMKFINLKLPAITSLKYPVKFLPHEQERYDAFKSEAHGVLEQAKARKGESTYQHLLEVLLRMRQTCNHWKMCGEARVNKVLALLEGNKAVDVLDPANRRALQDLLQIRIDSQEDCPVCIDTMSNPVITACAHAFCTDCIEKVINEQHKCPMCRAELVDNTLLVQPSAGLGESGDSQQAMEIDMDTSSSKVEALVQILQASEKEPNTKTVVFSQWTTFLDIVQVQLQKQGMNFTRLDGRMPASRRDAAIETLNSDPSCTIMLASLQVCSVGLNLVAANQVILSDSWWAPAIEDQAVDRVHRLGQTRACKVVRLVVEGTIEDEVLEVQAKKRELTGLAFAEKGQRNKRDRAEVYRDIERMIR